MSGFVGTINGKECSIHYEYSPGFHHTPWLIIKGSPRAILLSSGSKIDSQIYWHLIFESIDWKEL
jgi:hypothetical protein